MKRLAILFLFGIFLSTQLATLLQQYLRPVIHSICYSRAAKRMLRSNEPEEQLVLDVDVYQRSLTDHKEIRLNGRMYDIRSVRFENDKVILLVHADHAETRWVRLLDRIRESQDASKNTGEPQLAFQWFFKLFHPDNHIISVPQSLQPDRITSGLLVLVFPSSFSDSLIKPPDAGAAAFV